jgi:hypothetical protein
MPAHLIKTHNPEGNLLNIVESSSQFETLIDPFWDAFFSLQCSKQK